MEKKTTQRIIGAMVVGSLVIIALPLFFGKSEGPEKVAAIVTEPTPDTAMTEATAAPTSEAPPAVTQPTPETTAPALASASEPVQAATTQSMPEVTPVPEAATTKTVSAQPTSEAASAPEVATTAAKPTPAESTPAEISPQKPATPVAASTLEAASTNSIDITQEVIDGAEKTAAKNDDKIISKQKVSVQKATHQQNVTKLHQSAWVVQMGYFKNKNNAKQLTNKLRAAGFKAFMSTAKNGNKERTRVLIGPEYKQASAAQTSSRVNQAIKMKGIVIPYKPLAL